MKRIKVETPSQVNVTLKHKKHKFDLPTQEHDPQLPGVFVFSGTRGPEGVVKRMLALLCVKTLKPKGTLPERFSSVLPEKAIINSII